MMIGRFQYTDGSGRRYVFLIDAVTNKAIVGTDSEALFVDEWDSVLDAEFETTDEDSIPSEIGAVYSDDFGNGFLMPPDMSEDYTAVWRGKSYVIKAGVPIREGGIVPLVPIVDIFI